MPLTWAVDIFSFIIFSFIFSSWWRFLSYRSLSHTMERKIVDLPNKSWYSLDLERIKEAWKIESFSFMFTIFQVKNMNDSKRSYDLGPEFFFKWPRSTSFKSFLTVSRRTGCIILYGLPPWHLLESKTVDTTQQISFGEVESLSRL